MRRSILILGVTGLIFCFLLQCEVTGSAGAEQAASSLYAKADFMIPMRDGIHLHTVVFRPKEPREPLPFLVMSSPYRWDAAAQVLDGQFGDNLAREGYRRYMPPS